MQLRGHEGPKQSLVTHSHGHLSLSSRSSISIRQPRRADTPKPPVITARNGTAGTRPPEKAGRGQALVSTHVRIIPTTKTRRQARTPRSSRSPSATQPDVIGKQFNNPEQRIRKGRREALTPRELSLRPLTRSHPPNALENGRGWKRAG